MNILLINPPRSPHNAILEYAPAEAQEFIHRKLIGPPLGLLSVAGAVREHDVCVLDMKGEYDLNADAPLPDEMTRQYMARSTPRIVGVTFIASEFDAGLAILRAAKAADPTVLTVAGGLHAALCPEDFDDPAVDVLCTGPAVRSFPALVQAIEKDTPLEHVGGLMLRTERGMIATGPTSCEPAGADFVMPDRSHLDRWLSTYIVGRAKGPSTYLFTSLGCPYRCTFCSIWPQYEGHYLQREVESVIAELKTLDDYEAVRFADANTLVNPEFADKLFDRIAEEGIRKVFIMDIRFDTAAKHPELIAKLARGGLKVAIVGFESFKQEELERYRKHADAGLIEAAIRVFQDNGIMMRGNYVVPPDYGEADFDALAEYASANRVALAGYTILTPIPGMTFYDEVQDQIVDHDLAKYNFFNCVMKTALPLTRFYEKVGGLWSIRAGTETI
jgi:hopanoid C-3 methylase